MAIQKTEKIWHTAMIAWDDATIHVMSHVVHYGRPYSRCSLLCAAYGSGDFPRAGTCPAPARFCQGLSHRRGLHARGNRRRHVRRDRQQ